ncbi:hypothetical protein FB99_46720 (plasmid) [Pantoea agglomerans]|nr:hypothetical protein FB99_46720 [Pantoea agglomerans]
MEIMKFFPASEYCEADALMFSSIFSARNRSALLLHNRLQVKGPDLNGKR